MGNLNHLSGKSKDLSESDIVLLTEIKVILMYKSGPIVIVEDDADDKELFDSIIHDLGIRNEIKWFAETSSALQYLNTTQDVVFLIFCDINLPGNNGLDFKRVIDADPKLRRKSIPFVFLSTTASQQTVNQAYTEMVVQGFFNKQASYNELKSMLKCIFDYWNYCKHPNSK